MLIARKRSIAVKLVCCCKHGKPRLRKVIFRRDDSLAGPPALMPPHNPKFDLNTSPRRQSEPTTSSGAITESGPYPEWHTAYAPARRVTLGGRAAAQFPAPPIGVPRPASTSSFLLYDGIGVDPAPPSPRSRNNSRGSPRLSGTPGSPRSPFPQLVGLDI